MNNRGLNGNRNFRNDDFRIGNLLNYLRTPFDLDAEIVEETFQETRV